MKKLDCKVFPSEEQTISVKDDDVYVGAHRYTARHCLGFNNGQTEYIDGTIESYFYHYDPTMSNVPASDWTTTALREAHLDDTFTNLDSGQSWRFTKNTGNVYSWTLMDEVIPN